MSPKDNPKPIGLAELICQVKRELLNPEGRKDDPVPLFAVDESSSKWRQHQREGQAGINIQVLNVGGGASREDAQTVR